MAEPPAHRSSDLPLSSSRNHDDVSTVIVSQADHSDTTEVWPVGSPLDDCYKVLEVRGGRGVSGMGIVYIVEGGGGLFAVKTFQRRFAHDLLFIQRFIREARTWMLVGFHPNVVRAYQLDIIHAAPYLFMEYVDSDVSGRHALSDLIKSGPLPLEQALHYALQCCQGMAHATAAVPGLVHRDLKPENLLINPQGVLKITDFGLVRCRDDQENSLQRLAHPIVLSDGHLTAVGSIFGTPAYMAPEQFSEASTVTSAADIYAWGCTFYEAFTGAPPFTVSGGSTLERVANLKRKHLEAMPAPLQERCANCPEALNHIVMKCLEKDPLARWQSFDELSERLSTLVAALDCAYPLPARVDPPPRQIAEQMRSLGLLDGYEQAIRLRRLRENQEQRPYALHLALASYFLCHNDPHEERRQLEKAARARTTESGYEVARRLADLYLHDGKLQAAETLLEDFLAEHPEELERVLEPRVRLLCLCRRCAEAEAILDRFNESRRIQVLRVEVLRASGRDSEVAQLLQTMLREALDRLESLLAQAHPNSRVGWEQRGDLEVLLAVLSLLRPELDCCVLRVAKHQYWPELLVDVDFAPEMAWLSQAAGELAALGDPLDPILQSQLAHAAELLDFPNRLVRHLQRDECWFWAQEVQDPAESPSC